MKIFSTSINLNFTHVTLSGVNSVLQASTIGKLSTCATYVDYSPEDIFKSYLAIISYFFSAKHIHA